MTISCICEYCKHNEKEVFMEINFFDKKIYWYCPYCKKMNTSVLSQGECKPYPKGTTIKKRR